VADYDFVVDLSNVCRSEVLGAPKNGASLRALQVVSHALAAELDGRSPNLYLVADDSLWPKLERHDGRARVDEFRMRQRPNLTSIPYADRSILQYALAFECPVLSMDQYKDWRGVFPWIQGNRSLFYGWRERDGTIQAYRRTMAVLGEDSISRHEERRHLGDRNLDPDREADAEVLGRMYRCDTRTCELRNRCPEFLMYPPLRDRRTGQLVCVECGQRVTEVGPVGPVRQFRYELPKTRHRGRFTIYQEEPTHIGRRHLRDNLDASADGVAAGSEGDDNELKKVSSHHLELLAENDLVHVTDLGSRNGTDILRWDPKLSKLRPPEPLVPNEPVEFHRYDQLFLARAVSVRWSGRTYRFDGLTQGEPEADDEDGGTQVRSG
jgi:hypothetical protein